MKYFVIRRVKDKACYGRNAAYHTTGDHHDRHGFGNPYKPFLYSSFNRAMTSVSINFLVMSQDDIEIVSWSTTAMRRVWTNKGEEK